MRKTRREQREAPRNGIDLDINPGWLPPPPEPRLGAGPGAGRAKPGQLEGMVSRGGGQPAPAAPTPLRANAASPWPTGLCPESGALRASLCQARRQDALGARRLSEAAEPPVPGQAARRSRQWPAEPVVRSSNAHGSRNPAVNQSLLFLTRFGSETIQDVSKCHRSDFPKLSAPEIISSVFSILLLIVLP